MTDITAANYKDTADRHYYAVNSVPISDALILYNSGLNGGEPKFVVRRLGHDDYDNYQYKVGACFSSWAKYDERSQKLQLLIDAWHAVAFYGVPAKMAHEALLVIPEYREMLAEDCLPVWAR